MSPATGCPLTETKMSSVCKPACAAARCFRQRLRIATQNHRAWAAQSKSYPQDDERQCKIEQRTGGECKETRCLGRGS